MGKKFLIFLQFPGAKQNYIRYNIGKEMKYGMTVAKSRKEVQHLEEKLMSSEQEKQELYKGIWSIANDLRGSVDGWDFKAYVLGMLFYRYISENIANDINRTEWEAGDTDFNYEDLDDESANEIRNEMVETKGFFVLPSELFTNVRKRATNDDDLNITLKNIFSNIEASSKGTASERDFAGLFDDLDTTSKKLGGTVKERNERLAALLDGIGRMDLGDFKDKSIDTFGDVYEYLMGLYASNAGKSGGEYFTPQECSELLARLTVVGKDSVNKVYDPACGSGSLLLKYAKILGKDKVRNGYYGQEKNPTTYNLCRINMFLHDIDYDKFDIALGDTLTDPQHWDEEPFEAVVSNPPYSISWIGSDDPTLINDPRFSPAGVLAPKGKADLAFVMHILSWLAPNGVAAVVCFPGIMYRGGAEKKIRKYLIDNNFVDAVIQLPDNLFFGTSISTDIMVLKKSRETNRVAFIDASDECIKVTNSNQLSQQNIDNILSMYEKFEDKEHSCKTVTIEEIAKDGYNLSVSTYVERKDTREKIDVKKLNKYLEDVVKSEEELRGKIGEMIVSIDSEAE